MSETTSLSHSSLSNKGEKEEEEEEEEEEDNAITTTKEKPDDSDTQAVPEPTPVPPVAVLVRRQEPHQSKVKIHLIAVGSAPILKQSKFTLASNVTFGNLKYRLKKMLGMVPTTTTTTTAMSNDNGDNDSGGDPLYLYVQQSFIPSPDDWLGDLSDLYSIRDELQIHYSFTEAWG
eukprot:CAMPEP_0176495800 /NCGR_PEP_ID=MMETSP0200_2-20121128/10858_1 /TAXON_ID=947934 /ORGANISM="Chaetoceros sp., Strain GSL56" /LENGTH=174 /DNA_ID=CAMNT_0017893719 /DNA_START=64 /DNA_END=585 /DNA_ORIENTATION=+